MSITIKKIIHTISYRSKVVSNISKIYMLFGKNSYLNSVGWLNSKSKMSAVDKYDNPIPWLTYPIISFLEKRVTENMKVFEYGSGNSTLWWASKVNKVVSCEHDENWYQIMKNKLPHTVEYIFNENIYTGNYCEEILKSNNKFDIILIDGRDRVKCAINSISQLSDKGVIIWDDMYRESYHIGRNEILNSGFKVLDFDGLVPIEFNLSTTSIFYKEGNCLGI